MDGESFMAFVVLALTSKMAAGPLHVHTYNTYIYVCIVRMYVYLQLTELQTDAWDSITTTFQSCS